MFLPSTTEVYDALNKVYIIKMKMNMEQYIPKPMQEGQTHY